MILRQSILVLMLFLLSSCALKIPHINTDAENACFPNVYDCAGVCDGDATIDMCGTCDSELENDCIQDCAGQWGGNAIVDVCGICNGNNLDCEFLKIDPRGTLIFLCSALFIYLGLGLL